mgnify:FL=1
MTSGAGRGIRFATGTPIIDNSLEVEQLPTFEKNSSNITRIIIIDLVDLFTIFMIYKYNLDIRF